MTTAQREISVENGQPIRCYEFARGPLRWMYNGSDRDIEVGNKLFKTCPVRDSGIRFTGQASADPLTVTLPSDVDVCQMYMGAPPSDVVSLTVWDTHFGETDYMISWIGSISNVRRVSRSTCEITCGSLTASLGKPGLRLSWRKSCPLTLYDSNCRADPNLFRVVGRVQNFDGLVVLVPSASGFPDRWFAGGYLEWEFEQGVMERRGIRDHVGNNLSLLGGTYGLEPGKTVNLYPGCNRTTAVCDSKFNNIPNYGGVPGLPGVSPFDGNPVF
jgi:uncharacterized phage protein (TIGR02218 family)